MQAKAVALGKRVGVSQAAKDLYVGESNLRNWIQAVAAHGTQAFASLSLPTDVDAELRRLRKEVRVLRREKQFKPENRICDPPAACGVARRSKWREPFRRTSAPCSWATAAVFRALNGWPGTTAKNEQKQAIWWIH